MAKQCRADSCGHYDLGEWAEDLEKGHTLFPIGFAGVVKLFARCLRAFKRDIREIPDCQKCSFADKVIYYEKLLKGVQVKAPARQRSPSFKPSRRGSGQGRGGKKQSA